MEQYTKGTTRKVKRMVWVYSNGLMGLCTKENSEIMTSKEKVNMYGVMEEYTMAIGQRIN